MRCMMDVVKICKRDLRVPASSSFRNAGDACGEEDIMQILLEYIKLNLFRSVPFCKASTGLRLKGGMAKMITRPIDFITLINNINKINM